ncbi:hypothetical protein M422DRAFT_264735 [Sphaerobolus stellatus SS14]|uniref:Uncharacterized protein n=1 Tax=Sphaerobolus stellatus (strain SS14) TaxID=990650 RepID=A0A0C9V7E4_SPHS4|nr:hypothetical protein M422DRAFT_264735 [Sphaerobolus stellatus SS14]
MVETADYEDDKVIVVKFSQGLNPAIQNRVAEAKYGPDFEDPEAWYEATCLASDNKVANRIFERNVRTFSTAQSALKAPVSIPKAPVVPFRFLPFIPPATHPNPPPRPAEGPVPMDTGHVAQDCPQCFDVRSMTTKEQLAWAQQMLTNADLASVPTGGSEAEAVAEVEA